MAVSHWLLTINNILLMRILGSKASERRYFGSSRIQNVGIQSLIRAALLSKISPRWGFGEVLMILLLLPKYRLSEAKIHFNPIFAFLVKSIILSLPKANCRQLKAHYRQPTAN